MLLLAATTACGFLLDPYVSLTSQAMLYVLAVVIASYTLSWVESVVCAVGAVTVLHERNLILTVVFHDMPWIPFDERVQVSSLVPGFWKVQVNYGFKDTPNIPEALELFRAQGLPVNLFETSYFLSREIVAPTKGAGMAHWREALFAIMSRNSGSVAGFFQLPNNCVIELGTRVQI